MSLVLAQQFRHKPNDTLRLRLTELLDVTVAPSVDEASQAEGASVSLGNVTCDQLDRWLLVGPPLLVISDPQPIEGRGARGCRAIWHSSTLVLWPVGSDGRDSLLVPARRALPAHLTAPIALAAGFATRRLFVTTGLAAFLLLALATGSRAGHSNPAAATVALTSSGGIAFIRTSPNGSKVTLVIANPDGSNSQIVPLANRPETFSFPAWAPDGTKLLISHTFPLDASRNCCAPFRPAIVNPDGSGFTQLAMSYAGADSDCPTWSEGGTRILCTLNAEGPGVYSVRATDGSDPRLLIKNPFGNEAEAGDLATSISPNGKRFVFIRSRPEKGANRERDKMTALFIANLDGTGLRQITPYGLTAAHEDEWGAWSPDGHKILSIASGRKGHPGPITCFERLGTCLATRSHLFTIHPDGSGYHAIKLRLPSSTGSYRVLQPSWSPDGSRIVFCLWPTKGTEDIYTARADGTHVVRVTHTPAFEYAPRWRPFH